MLKVFVKSEILHACGWWASGSLDPGPNMSQSDWQSLNINHTFNIFSRTGERPCGQALWESVRIEGGEGPPPFLSPASSAVLLLQGRGVEPSQSLTSLFFGSFSRATLTTTAIRRICLSRLSTPDLCGWFPGSGTSGSPCAWSCWAVTPENYQHFSDRASWCCWDCSTFSPDTFLMF